MGDKSHRGINSSLPSLNTVPLFYSLIVVQTEPPDLRETNSLKSSVAELQERLALVDKSMIGLTRLVTDIMKYSVYSSTSSSSALSAYDLNELAIGKKRSIDTVDSCSPPKKYHEGQILLSQEGKMWSILTAMFHWRSSQLYRI